MDKREYVIAGHSHFFAMGAPHGYRGQVSLVKTPDDRGYFVMEEWGGGRSTEYWDKLVESSPGRDVLLVYHGSQHNGFLFAPEPLFDFVDESSPELLDGAQLVPRRLIEALFAPSLHQLRLLIPRLLAVDCRSVRLIGTPPPKADTHAFADKIRQMEVAKVFARSAGVDLASAKITPASLLLKLWRVVQKLTAQVAVGERVAFVPVPPEATDAQGFLARPFYADVTHANRGFGQLMTERALQSLPS